MNNKYPDLYFSKLEKIKDSTTRIAMYRKLEDQDKLREKIGEEIYQTFKNSSHDEKYIADNLLGDFGIDHSIFFRYLNID